MSDPTPQTISALVDTARESAEAAARVHRAQAGRIRVEEATEKRGADFVTRVDTEAQEAALAVIRDRFPEHRILSEEEDGRTGPLSWEAREEESGEEEDSSDSPGFLWIVDPLDGTTNFLHGHPAYVASVGVVLGIEPLAGAVVASATEERWWAGRGLGAFRNGRRIRVSEVQELRWSLVGTGFPFKRLEQLHTYLEELERVLPATSGIRRGGSAALDLCYLAQGSLDAFWEGRLDPWDVAAGLAILYEAGGVASRKDGGKLRVPEAGSILAANAPELMERLRSVVNAPGD